MYYQPCLTFQTCQSRSARPDYLGCLRLCPIMFALAELGLMLAPSMTFPLLKRERKWHNDVPLFSVKRLGEWRKRCCLLNDLDSLSVKTLIP